MMTTSNVMSSRTDSQSLPLLPRHTIEPFSSPSRSNPSPSSQPRHLTSPYKTGTINSYRKRSYSHSSSPSTMALPISIPPSNSPVMPFLPNLSISSNSLSMSPTGGGVKRWSISSEEKAMDSAMVAERTRIKELEKKESETDLTVEDLKAILKRERSRSSKLVGELAAMKSMAVASQAEAEVCEEGRINGLMRRLDCLQKEKGRIIVELEREEEMLTNTLQKKLNEVRREKAELEKQIEREHSNNLELKGKLELSLNNQCKKAFSADSIPSLGNDENMEEE